MRTTCLVLGMLALGGLGCTVTVDSSGSDGGMDAGLDAGGGGAGGAGGGDADAGADAGGMSGGMQPRTGTASEGKPPERDADRDDGAQAGKGNTSTDTQQDGDDGDPVWMDEEDVTGDGRPESVTSLLDDETGDFYVWYTLIEDGCKTEVLVIFDGDGEGGEGDGSGRYVIDSSCDDTGALLGCEFDADGMDTVCGVCDRDELDAVWQCIARGIDPFACECDVDFECSDNCPCDVECLEMCECDVDFTCSEECPCDFECVFGECPCDVDGTCSEQCSCDMDC